MLRVLNAAAAVVLLGATAASAAAPSAATTRPAATTTFSVECRSRAAVKPDERTAVEGLSTTLFERLTAGQMDNAFALLAPDIQQTVGRAAFDRSLAFVRDVGSWGAPRVTRTYLLDVTGEPPQETTSCEGPDGLPEAYVAIHAFPRQAHVTIEADAAGERWSFTSWLRFKDGRWDVYAIDVRSIAVGELGAAEIYAMAREQRARDHPLSAWLLYRAARALAGRGDYLSLPLLSEIEDDTRAWDASLLEPGELPLFWTSGRTTYGVQDSMVAALDGRPWVQLQRWTSVWGGEREIKAENRRVLAAFIKEHPDWAESFAGVELKSFHPDGRQAISTLYSKERGYYEVAR